MKVEWGADGVFTKVSSGANAIPIQDGGNSITIDGTVTIGTSVTPGTAATDLGKAEDAVHASGDVGVMALGVRRDTASSLAGLDGDYIPLIVDANGRLHVVLSAATNQPVNTAQVAGTAVDTNSGNASAGTQRIILATNQPNLTSPLNVILTTGAAGIGRLTANSGIDIGDVDILSIIPGTTATSLGKAEDAVHTTGDTGVYVLAVRSDTPAASGANGDYCSFVVDANGRLHTSAVTSGLDAVDAPLSATNPAYMGGRASTATPTAVSADNDAQALWLDRRGALHTVPGAASTATLSNVADTASSTAILTSNTSRKGVMIHNDSTSILYIKYGATASLTSYSVKISADGFWEMPVQPVYTGAIDGIWSSNSTGSARITELT